MHFKSHAVNENRKDEASEREKSYSDEFALIFLTFCRLRSMVKSLGAVKMPKRRQDHNKTSHENQKPMGTITRNERKTRINFFRERT